MADLNGDKAFDDDEDLSTIATLPASIPVRNG